MNNSQYYACISKYENRYPGSVGFFDPDTEIFVIKESILPKLFNPHFYTYNHRSKEIQKYCFKQIEQCPPQLLEFLNTIRNYSTNREHWPLNRNYYDDLVCEWETVNKCYIHRRFVCK